MTPRRDICSAWSLRLVLAGLVLLCGFGSAFAQTLLPAGFFDNLGVSPTGQAAIEADILTYDDDADVIIAEGDVIMLYEGNTLRADRVVYRQGTGEVTADGNVEVIDADGNRYVADHIDVTGNFQKAFVRALTLTTPDGTMITADDADFNNEVEIILNQSTYSPCGLCIDNKGRRIGWRVKASKMVYIRDKGTIELFNPSLELLGVPMAWLPWISIPDPSQPRLSGFRLPKFDYSKEVGFSAELPYFWGLDDDTDVIFIPRLMSRQGALFGIDVTRRFTHGSADVKVSGVYQLDPSAFVNTVGDRQWRGAMQTTGHFTPYENWAMGWSYTTFSDAAYLVDYRLTSAKNLVNEAFVTYLTRNTFFDLRVQDFNLLGNVTPIQQQQHAKAIPNLRAEQVEDLPNDLGQVRLNGTLLGVYRGADQTTTLNGVPYVYAYRETKFHGTAEASWQKQFIVPGGFAVTPFAGIRLDAADYDGGSVLKPGEVSLLTATPIAALDVRWPIIAFTPDSAHLFEPIAQIVYRGSDEGMPGITNDNAISFVLDDSNIFSYNRFSGSDRQETGLRANFGARYEVNFDDGGWVELLAGQSFFLAGSNSLSLPDPTQTGLHTGLGTAASYVVLGARAGFGTLQGNTKFQIDPNAGGMIRRIEAGAAWSNTAARFSAATGYVYVPADPVIGVIYDVQQVGGGVAFPVADYWTGNVGVAWDITNNALVDVSAALTYDDNFFAVTLGGVYTGPAHSKPNDFRVGASFKLRGPGGVFAF